MLVQVKNEGILSLTLNLTSDKDLPNSHNRLCVIASLPSPNDFTLLSFTFMLVQVKNEGILSLTLDLTSDKDLPNSHVIAPLSSPNDLHCCY